MVRKQRGCPQSHPGPRSFGMGWRGPVSALASGMAMGAAARWLDIHSEFFGTLFSNIAIWALLCTVIAVRSRTPRRAGGHVFLFLSGMLVLYYSVAAWTGGVWSIRIAFGWAAVAVVSPLLGYIAWFAGGRDKLAWLLSGGIVLFMAASTWFLFGKLRVSDLVVIGLTACFLCSARRRASGRPESSE